MLALRSAPPVFGAAEAERIAFEVYGLTMSAVALAGERDCNFHLRTAGCAGGRDFILKIVDGSADPGTIDCQISVLKHLAAQDPLLPVPRIHPTRMGADLARWERDGVVFTACLMEYLPGRLLAVRRPDRGLLRQLGHTLARVDRALQGFFHPAMAQRIAWDVRRLPELVQYAPYIEQTHVRTAVEVIVRAVQERGAGLLGLRSQAIHGDCHAGNLLIDAGGAEICGVLDFGDMIHAPLIMEPAVAMSELLTEALAEPEALAAVIEGYAPVLAFETVDIDMLYDLIVGRHAVTLLVHAWRRRHDVEGALLVARAAAESAASLENLRNIGRDALTRAWQTAAGLGVAVPTTGVAADVSLSRRHRLLGAGAELFYDVPLHLVRGEGVWLYDAAGHAYLDVYNNVPHVGHCHPTVVRAIARQSALLATHTRYLHEHVLDYAEALTARCAPPLDACIFVNSGSEANDVAWRMARFATGQEGALIVAHAYHGITDAAAALTPVSGHPLSPRVATLAPPPDGLGPDDAMDAGVLATVAADVDAALDTLRKRGFAPAAFFVDSSFTSSGIHDPPTAWLAVVTERVRAAGGLVVGDEVQYGLGRPGSHFWGFERRGLSPDIVTLGKPVANGYPMGVVVASRGLIESFQAKFGIFSTFGGNPVAAAAGLAVLDVLDRERLVENARTTGGYLRQQLAALAVRYPEVLGRVRGNGLLLGLEVRARAGETAKLRARRIVNSLAARSRILIGHEGPRADILKLRPPMPFLPAHADFLVQAIDAAVTGGSDS